MLVIKFFSSLFVGGGQKEGVPFFKLTQGEHLNCERNHKNVIIKSQPDLACVPASCAFTPDPPAPPKQSPTNTYLLNIYTGMCE